MAKECLNPQTTFFTGYTLPLESLGIVVLTGVRCLDWKKGAVRALPSPPVPHYPKVSSPIAITSPFFVKNNT
jgi:hypothetical protein